MILDAASRNWSQLDATRFQGVPKKGTPYASGPGRRSMMNLLSSGGEGPPAPGVPFYVRAYHGVIAALVQAIAVQLTLSILRDSGSSL